MRYISELSDFSKETLAEMHKKHPKRRARMRAHIILLSSNRYKMGEIAKIYGIQQYTVSRCLTNWENNGIVGLFDKPKSGRSRLLTPDEENRAYELIKEDRRNSKKAQSILEKETGKKISEWTFKRTLKRSGLRWKRMRRSTKDKQDPEKFERGKEKIEDFQEREDKGEIDLYYFDESGVNTIPDVPYGWQLAGETVELPSHRSKRINILGFLTRKNDFYYETVEGWVNSDNVISCFDNFANGLTKSAVVIVDNASMHTSKKFRDKKMEWEEKGMIIHHLPTYSPELNLIEILWRFLKYNWLSLSAYESYQKLKENLLGVLDAVGSKHAISFA